MQPRAVAGRPYSWLSPRTARWAISLERPRISDDGILAAFAGTYTSPQNEVEGVVMVDGQLLREGAKPWAGLLIIRDGQVEVRQAPGGELSKRLLQQLRGQRASLLQGHLLVYQRKAQAFQSSPELPRRAIVVGAKTAAVVESQGAVALQPFAQDLAEMGAVAAMNLDMGGWSEGFVRLTGGKVRRLREAGATARQTNWLLLCSLHAAQP